jgi:hypothetical protein
MRAGLKWGERDWAGIKAQICGIVQNAGKTELTGAAEQMGRELMETLPQGWNEGGKDLSESINTYLGSFDPDAEGQPVKGATPTQLANYAFKAAEAAEARRNFEDQAVVLKSRAANRSVVQTFIIYLRETGWFYSHDISSFGTAEACMEAYDRMARDSEAKTMLYNLFSAVHADIAARWTALDGGRDIKSDTVKSRKQAMMRFVDRLGICGKFREQRTTGGYIIGTTGNPFDSDAVQQCFTSIKRAKVKKGEPPRKRAECTSYEDYSLAIHETFAYRHPSLFDADWDTKPPEEIDNFSIVKNVLAVTLPVMCHTLHQRSEFTQTPGTHMRPTHQIGSNVNEDAYFKFNPSGQKTYKQGTDIQKLLKHTNCGEGCFHGGSKAWYDAGKDGSGPGYCALCLHMRSQKLLDAVYKAEFNGKERSEDPEAYPYPSLDSKTKKVNWHACYTATDLTVATQQIIVWSNLARERLNLGPQKDPTLYTSHSNKTGGVFELLSRNVSLHEAQRVTGHMEVRNVVLYGMLMGDMQACQLITEMQQPPLRVTHSIHSTRQLSQQLLDGFKVIASYEAERKLREVQHQERISHLEKQAKKQDADHRTYATQLEAQIASRDAMLKEHQTMFNYLLERMQQYGYTAESIPVSAPADNVDAMGRAAPDFAASQASPSAPC